MSTPHGDLQWFSNVQAAFPDKQELCQRIFAEASYEPTRLPRLFEDISRYVLGLKAQTQAPSQPIAQELPSNAKKRKIAEDGSSIPSSLQKVYNNDAPPTSNIGTPVVSLEVKEISVQIPARKKLNLQMRADAADRRRGEICLLNPTTHSVEYSLAASDIDQAFCLPVPDKQQRQSYFAVFPKPHTLSQYVKGGEQLLFTLNDALPLPATLSTPDEDTALGADDTYTTATIHALQTLLAPYSGAVTLPSASEFSSQKPQHHRKGEPAYHVHVHRGNKEGYLFFLDKGIVFGFKKPLAFFPFERVESISYTSVLQRTFNLVVAYREVEADGEEVKEVEFSMLDQEDFPGIDAYVKRHGLNDASMAAERRAKAYNVNKNKAGEQVNGDGKVDGGGVEGGELERAQEQALQDEEDEEEEDYEASGGESDGEFDSEEDDDGEGDGEGVGYDEEDSDDDGELFQ